MAVPLTLATDKESPAMLIYYVYAYLRSDGTPYYIGKGKGIRAFKKSINHYPPEDKSLIVFLETNLTELGAHALERRYIRWYGRKDLGTGILRNLTDGGEGCSGLIFSEEHRRKMSEVRKGKPGWNKGKKLSEEHRRNMKGRGQGRGHWLGKKMSEETRRKMSEVRKGKKHSEEARRNMRGVRKGKVRV